MKRLQTFIVILFVTIAFSVFFAMSNNRAIATAPFFKGMGTHHHAISTKSPQAQRYFDQGLVLAYGFNHAEAARSFREAIKLDRDCAMCNWGLAYVLGPNINAKMDDEAVPEAYGAIQRALKLAEKSNPSEQSYINALATRYVAQPLEDRSALDLAYAEAMAKVAQQYPDDLDAATLYAEALMDTMPWDYWTEEKTPKAATQKVLDTLDSVLQKDANHPGANHLYIHAVEAVRPEQAIAAADRLGGLVPGSGHLVHMPSHIYIRVGRYRDAVVTNQNAIAVDDEYITQCHAQGVYPLAYMPHNRHFLWFAATLEGNRKIADEAGKTLAAGIDPEMMREPGLGTLQHFYSIPLFTMTRFGEWDEILQAPQPAVDLKYPTGLWHYARGLAYTRQDKFSKAEAELQALTLLANDPELEEVTIWDINTTQNILQVAAKVLTGEIAAQQGESAQAIASLRQAVVLEDALNYDEPADWATPARQYLGAALLEAKEFAAAEQAYREDLAIYPDNGWSLFGLRQSLQAQGKDAAAQKTQQQFEAVWQYADVQLTASRF
ncbi:hypothetical protein Xen7305DRAFT_00028840 [Xenococcus sp. PCC 7305]|uniref:hypothetical protein n=1 Tax=Xenococcus sp. PCC 7305 TaxID=102125 RepID=UPI0002ACC072|nr:hypothetical protein Xen7305DRAFT_00028840 [Xenococcus sp. PCC 7305]